MHAIEIMERHADKLHIVRYEDLVQQPQSVLKTLASWLGVDAGGFPTYLIRDISVGKHHDGLSDDELTTVMNIAGPTLARFGYV